MYRTITIFSLFASLVCYNSLLAQILPMQEAMLPEAVEYYRNGEQYLLEKDYRKALRSFNRCLKVQPGLSAAHRGLGISYSLLNDFDNAMLHYEIIVESDSMLSRALYYELGDTYYKAGMFKKALVYFRKFQDLQKEELEDFGLHGEREIEREKEYLEKISHNLRACQVSLDSLNFGKITNITNLGSTVNTVGDEYFPFVSNDQKMLFFTHRKNSREDENLFYSTASNSGRWRNRSPFKFFNTPAQEGRFTMVRDGKKMFFTICEKEGLLGICDIWEGVIEDGEISEIQSLGRPVNSANWESQVSVSCDGSQLFFASNRGNANKDNSDIWYSTKQPDGSWGSPVKLGPHINTPGAEEAPFLTNDGKTLYFSSSHVGFGGSDIFMSWLDEETGDWSHPINVGQPLNSPHNESGFFLCADGKTGYFASDRPNGGLGVDLDIYKFELDEQLFSDPITFVEGYVRDSVYEITVEATIGVKGLDSIRTDKNGRFFLCLPANSTLDVTLDLANYDHYENVFAIPEWDNKGFYNVDLLINPIYSLVEYESGDTTVIEEKKEKVKEEKDKETIIRTERTKTEQYSHTVYFKFDSYELKPNESGKISDFISELEAKNITRVEIIGYADDIGPDTYNLKLSEERAKRLALFLMEKKDLEVDQIYLEGRGEIRDDKPKDLNRKVDIKIYTEE